MFKDVMLTLFSAALSVMIMFLTIKKLFNNEIKILSLKFILSYLIIVILTTLLYLITQSFFRIVFLYCCIVLIVVLVFKKSIKKMMLSAFFGYLIVTISEIITAIIVSIFLNFEGNLLKDEVFLNIGLNILIFVIGIGIINVPFVSRFMTKMVAKCEKLKISTTFLLSIIGILLIGSFLYCSYFQLSITYLLILNIFIIGIYMIVIYNYTKEINDKTIIEKEYTNLIKNLRDYEKLYEYQRIQNHENKNQLLTIRSLVKKGNKQLLEYIDDLTKMKFDDNNELMKKLRKIPYGGLRGLLYSKFVQIEQDKNVSFSFFISKEIELVDFKLVDDETNRELCKIFGILLDNAIEACYNLKSKQISVQIYKEDNRIVFTVENTVNNNFNPNKIYEKGFSTKGNGRGYGLCIVKEIIDKNPNITNSNKIIRDMFIQEIKIKM